MDEQHEAQNQLQESMETEDSEDIEDVKVCDICGDAGVEELLAVCSRCSDGAEHTYCMQKKLKELPKGDWLCEECKLKEETKKQNADKSDTVTGNMVECSAKNSLNPKDDFDPKLLPKLDAKAVDSEDRRVSEKPQSPQICGKRPADTVEVDVKTKKRVLESTDVSAAIANAKNRCLLLSEGSFGKTGADKLKQVKPVTTSGGQSVNNSFFARSKTFAGPNSSKMLDPVQSSKGTLSKSVSFNNSNMKPKVQFIENIPQKQKMSRELSDTRKGQVKKMSESTSFKSIHVRNTEFIRKSQSLHPPQTDNDFRCPNERCVGEKKSAMQERPPSSIAPVAGLSNLRPKSDPEVGVVSEPKVPDISTGPCDIENSECNDVKSSYVSKTSGLLRAIRTAQKEGGQGILGAAECALPQIVTHQNDKAKDAALLGVSKQTSGGGGLLRCKKCNETGHPTQFCSIDKLPVAALKPSAERDPYKSNKLKDVADAGILKSTVQKDVTMSNHLEKLPILGATKGFQSISSSCADMKSMPLVLPSAPSIPANALRSTVIPELEFIWQGGFDVLRCGRFCKSCDGVQAHLSTHASPKVLEAAIKFPSKIQLEEITYRSSWPPQCQKDSPEEDNIAIFFFAKDIESYEKNYSKLLENMIKNDLALKGNIAGAELLIVPSNKLPQNSQRWNRLFFLWGVFKGRGSNCLDTSSHSHDKPLNANLNYEPPIEDIPIPASEVTMTQKLNSNKDSNKGGAIFDQSTELKAVNSNVCANFQPTSPSDLLTNTSCFLRSGVENERTWLQNFDSAGNKVVNPPSLKRKMEKREPLEPNVLQINEPGESYVDLRPSRKDSLSKPAELFSRAAVSQPINLNGTVDFPPGDDIREQKKLKSEGRVIHIFEEQNLTSRKSPNINPSSASCYNFDQERIMPGSSRTDEKTLFPLNFGSVRDTNANEIVHIPSSDDEGPPDVPNLELALGGKKKSEENSHLSSLNAGDDVAASLSLSLSFNGSEKKQKTFTSV